MPYVYVIRRINSDSFYAGSTNNFVRRWGEHKRALSKAKKGGKVSETHREALVEHWSKMFSDTEWVAKRAAKIKERYKDPELREKMRQQALKRWNKNAVCS